MTVGSDFFQQLDRTVPMDRQDDKVDPVFYTDDDPEIYIVTSSKDRHQERIYKTLLKKGLGRDVRIAVLYCYKMFPTEKDRKGIMKYVRDYSVDLSRYIPRNSKVVTVGSALYSITRSSDITAEAFYNYRYLDSYFFSPDLYSWIFPIDGTNGFYSYDEKRFIDGFITMFAQHQLVEAVNMAPYRIKRPELVVVDLNTPEKVHDLLLSHTGKKEEVAFDIETTGLLWYNDDIICVTLSFDGITGYYLRWKDIVPSELDAFFQDKYCIGQNCKFDCKFLRYHGVRSVKIDFDTLNASQLVNDGGYSDSAGGSDLAIHGLDSLGWLYTLYGGHKNEMHEYNAERRSVSFGTVRSDILIDYAVKDAIVTYLVYERLKQIIARDEGFSRFYYGEEIPNLNMFIKIEMTDALIDFPRLVEMKTDFENKKKELHSRVVDEAIKMMVLGDDYLNNKSTYSLTMEDRDRYRGYDIDLESMHKLSLAFENDLHMPCLGRGKDGTYTTADPMLVEWANDGYDICKIIAEYREYSTFLKTFIGSEYDPTVKEPTAYWKFKDHNKNAVHPTYAVMLADSHRNKCYSPNFQQVPKQGYLAKTFRKIFLTPDENEKRTVNDYVVLDLEDGRTLQIPYGERCEVLRDGKRMIVLSENLLDIDEFIGVNTIDN